MGIYYCLYLCSQGQMKYGVEGFVPAPYLFGVRESTGQVYVKTSLRNDKGFEYVVSGSLFDNILIIFDRINKINVH